MRTFTIIAVFCLALSHSGCGGVRVTTNPAPVKIQGSLTGSGQNWSDVEVNFQPTGNGLPGVAKVTEGKFEVDLTPGKYTYFLTASPKASKKIEIPAAFQAGSLDRQVEITTPASIELSIN